MAAKPGATSDATKPPETARELPEADIYEVENFGSDLINEELAKLQADLKEKLKNRKDIKAQCVAYNNLGTAFFRLFKFDKAELCHHHHFLLSKPVTTAIPFADKRPGDKNEEKIALVNLGCVYKGKREFELALQTFKNALDLAEELGDLKSSARTLNNMGNIYEQVCDFDSAVECELKRMDLVTDLCDVNGQIKCAAALGSLYQLKGEIRDSIMYYEKAVINLRMKIVKQQMAAMEDPEKIEENPAFYDG